MTESFPQRILAVRRPLCRVLALLLAPSVLLGAAPGADARSAGDPIVLSFEEGDLVGLQTVWAEGGERPIGTVEFRQRRDGDVLDTLRIARFADGSSDEDLAIARVVDGRLEALRGHQIMRDPQGQEIVNVQIDVAGGRVQATWGPPDARRRMDERVALPPGTYWGALIFIVLKNFESNAEGNRVAFHTVAPTPRPMMLDLELVQADPETLTRPGLTLQTERYRLRPTLHWIVDPIIARLAPDTSFWTLPGEPPGLAQFRGPRNYGRDRIVLR